MFGRACRSVAAVAACFASGVFGNDADASNAPSHGIETLRVHAGRSQSGYCLDVEEDRRGDHTLRLMISGHGRLTAVAVEGGLTPTTDALDASLSSRNTLHSRFLFTAPPVPKNMVIVFGRAFASDPGAMRIIRLSGRAGPEQVFSERTFQLIAIQTDADDHSLLIIGNRSLSQMNGKCRSTYDPYSVFKLDGPARGRFRYSLALSKAYNLAHYAGWAGPDAREDIAVDTCQRPERFVTPDRSQRR